MQSRVISAVAMVAAVLSLAVMVSADEPQHDHVQYVEKTKYPVIEEMERVENELTMAAEEMKRLRDENEALKANGASKKSKPSPPAPPLLPPTPPPLPVKVPSEIPESSDPSGGAGARRDRNSSGFKTMSIDNRSQSVSGTDHDRLRQSYDHTTREKDRLETELARTQQELQLLKMRQK